MKDNSIKRDWIFGILGLIGFLAVLGAVNFLNTRWNLPQAFAVLTWVSWLTNTLIASAIAVTALRVCFKQTLGRGLGKTFDLGWMEMMPIERTRWMLGAIIGLTVAILLSGSANGMSVRQPDSVATNLALPVSAEAKDLIIRHEVGGRSYYESRLAAPTVPAWQTTASGVTVGFGFDVGHSTPAQIRAAFAGVLPDAQIEALVSAAGKKGADAHYNALPAVRHTVRVSWEQARTVFERDTLPRYTQQTKDAFRLTPERLHPHANGALVSLVFNRGSSLGPEDISPSHSRYEMRMIDLDIATGYAGRVPNHIRSMKRLWAGKNLAGLLRRRDDEAALFQRGLDARSAE